VRFTKNYSGYKIKEDCMGGACSRHEKVAKCIHWLKIVNGRDKLEDLGVDERIILEWILEK
jgi:hypothetical protein